jgi:hypothetical protein
LKPPSDGIRETPVSAPLNSNLFYPDIALSDSGFCIVYQSIDGGNAAEGIIVKKGKTFKLSLEPKAFQVMMPRVASLSTGDFAIALEGRKEGIYRVYWGVFGNEGIERRKWIEIKKKGNIGNPDLAVLDSLVLIAYQDGSGVSWDIFMSLFKEDGSPLKLDVPVFISDSLQDLSPRVLSFSHGFVVAWTSWGRGVYSVMARFFDRKLEAITPPIELEEDSKDVELTSKGDTTIFLWVKGEKTLKGALFDSKGTEIKRTNLIGPRGGRRIHPDLALGKEGIWLLWADSEYTDLDVLPGYANIETFSSIKPFLRVDEADGRRT